jgi:hypothetical protein
MRRCLPCMKADAEGKNRTGIYETILNVACQQAGISGFTLPQDASALQSGKYYQALFKFFRRGTDIKVQLHKVELAQSPASTGTTVLDKAIDSAQNHLWLDTVSVLAAQMAKGNADAELKYEWSGLLSDHGLEEISDRPIVNCIAVAE